jgi:predicted lysophospholipase L1 biosynthesis ABC-type transport system permease subunit
MADKRKLTGVGLALGAAFGTVAGVLAGHIAVWLAIGIAIGVAIGASFRRSASDCPECAMVHQEHQAREHGNKLGANS